MEKWLDNLKRLFPAVEAELLGIRTAWKTLGWTGWLALKFVDDRPFPGVFQDITDLFGKQTCVALIDLLEYHQKAFETSQLLAKIKIESLKCQSGNNAVGAHAEEILTHFRQLPDKIFGMDAHLANLERLLLGESGGKWIGVCGMGGIGKTLLAEQAFNGQNVAQRFQSKFWVAVGPTPLVRQLLQDLAAQMNIETGNMAEAEVKTKLFNALRGREVLIVLDDVWDDGVPVLDWFDVTSGTRSKILVTTRHGKVSKNNSKKGWQTEWEYSLDVLQRTRN